MGAAHNAQIRAQRTPELSTDRSPDTPVRFSQGTRGLRANAPQSAPLAVHATAVHARQPVEPRDDLQHHRLGRRGGQGLAGAATGARSTRALYIEGRGALKRELVPCLRTGRALRKPRERSRNKPQGHVTADVVLSERPAEAEDRAVPGHWEGDLIIGLNRSAIGTVVDRASRYTMLVHLPRMAGYDTAVPVKKGPALGGYGAIAMKDALVTTMSTMPAELLRSLT